MDNSSLGPGASLGSDWMRTWRERFEGEAAAGMERMVAGEGFAELLVQLTENIVAVSRISADVWGLVVRNLGLAGRADIDRLAGQLERHEDKLELVLQAVERGHDELAGR